MKPRAASEAVRSPETTAISVSRAKGGSKPQVIAILLLMATGAGEADTGRRWRRFSPASTGLQRSIFPNLGPLTACAFDRSGAAFAVGGTKGGVKIYRTREWTLRRSIPGMVGRVFGLAFNSDGTRLAVATALGITIYDVAGGGIVLSMRCPRVSRLAWSPCGRWIAAVAKPSLRVWDAGTGREVRSFPLTLRAARMLFQPGGSAILVSDGRGTVRVCSMKDGKESLTLRWLPDRIAALGISPDGKRLYAATFGSPARIRSWNLENGRTIGEGVVHRKGTVTALRVLSGGRFLAAAIGEEVQILDAELLRPVATLRHHAASIEDLAVSPRARWIATAGNDLVLKIWGYRPGGMSRVPAKGFFGVQIQDTGGDRGARVTSVIPMTAAAQAGIRVGDVIVQVGEDRVGDIAAAIAAIGTRGAGDPLDFRVLRDGKEIRLRAKLGPRPPTLDR